MGGLQSEARQKRFTREPYRVPVQGAHTQEPSKMLKPEIHDRDPCRRPIATSPIEETLKRSPLSPQQVPLKGIKSFHVMAEILKCICYCSTPSSILTNALGIENGTQMWKEAAPDGDVTM